LAFEAQQKTAFPNDEVVWAYQPSVRGAMKAIAVVLSRIKSDLLEGIQCRGGQRGLRPM